MCLFNTSTFPKLSSITITSVSLSSFNCTFGNTASNVNCTIENDADSFFGKRQYKNWCKYFLLFAFSKWLFKWREGKVDKNIFLPKSNFVFPITKRNFCYNWLSLYSWPAYFPVCDGAYCLIGASSLFWLEWCSSAV